MLWCKVLFGKLWRRFWSESYLIGLFGYFAASATPDKGLVILIYYTFILPLLRGVSIDAGGSCKKMDCLVENIPDLDIRNSKQFLAHGKWDYTSSDGLCDRGVEKPTSYIRGKYATVTVLSWAGFWRGEKRERRRIAKFVGALGGILWFWWW
jgi:hypothetical protein